MAPVTSARLIPTLILVNARIPAIAREGKNATALPGEGKRPPEDNAASRQDQFLRVSRFFPKKVCESKNQYVGHCAECPRTVVRL